MKHLKLVLFLLAISSVADAAPDLELTGNVSQDDPQTWVFDVRLSRLAPVCMICDEVGGRQEQHLVKRGPALSHHISVQGLKANTRYRCRADVLDDSDQHSKSVDIETAKLPTDLAVPHLIVPSSNVAETGYTLYNYGILTEQAEYESNYMVILDADGEVRWYYPDIGGGDIDATYLGNDTILVGGHGPNFGPPPHYIRPMVINFDKEVVFTGTRRRGSPNETPGSYNHDVGISADGQSIFSLVYTIVDQKWRAFSIKEINFDNEVVWFWDAVLHGVDQGVLEAGSAENNDPYHPNAIYDRWENGRLYLYLNLRNMHQVFKIDYLSKNVVWKCGIGGDFTLLERDGTVASAHRWFFHEHDVKMYGNQMVVYDNGSTRHDYGGMDYSRALRLELNEETMTARIMYEYTDPYWSEPIWGGLDWLDNGNYLVAMGHFWLADAQSTDPSYNSSLVEVDEAGHERWRVEFGAPSDSLYRADRIDGCAIFDNSRFCPSLASFIENQPAGH